MQGCQQRMSSKNPNANSRGNREYISGSPQLKPGGGVILSTAPRVTAATRATTVATETSCNGAITTWMDNL